MNWYFAAAAVLLTLIGLVHSVLGERLIFRRLRGSGFIPTEGGTLLREPHVRILWASWHLVTVMGGCVAAVLCWSASQPSGDIVRSPVPAVILVALLASSALVLVGTKGRHPGWVGLLCTAILAAFGIWA